MTTYAKTFLLLLCLPLTAGAEYSRPDNAPPPADLGQTWVEIDGQVYGAKPNEVGPIGGGEGYQRIVTDGDHRVATVDELIEALKKAQAGEVVYVEPDAQLDFTTLVFAEKLVLEIPEGVTLASNRGHEGSRGAMICSDAFATRPLIRPLGPNVRITGLWIRGPDPKRRLDHHQRSFKAERGDSKVQHVYYYKFPMSSGISSEFPGLEVDNCELSGWSISAVGLSSGTDHHIHHNYIHHNQMNGLGYGVCHSTAASLIEYNLFDFNRHSIAGSGRVPSGYEASNNVEMGVSLSHMFDMHGGADRGDGTNIAGDWMKIHHNTFRGRRVAAIVIRGVPSEGAEIYSNWFYHTKPGRQVIGPWPTGGDTQVDSYNNAYGQESPAIWDAEYQTYREALEAAMTAYKAKNYAQARASFGSALALAGDGAERSKAQLYIGHCYSREKLIGIARAQYEALLNAKDADPGDRAAAQRRLMEIREAASAKSVQDWTLVFSDDFEREELGENWKVLHGDWHIEAGKLVTSGGYGEIAINKRFPGCHRIEFEAMTRAERPCDFSPVIQSAGAGFEGGYLLQFGGGGNTVNRILRGDDVLEDRSADRFIQAGEVHKVAAEFDGDAVRLTVDGSIIVEGHEAAPLLGEGHDMVGLYIYCDATVDNVRVYTSKPR